MESDMLTTLAEDAIKRAIEITAQKLVGDEARWDSQNAVRDLLKKHINEICAEPEIRELLKAKVIETINGLPATMTEKRRSVY